MRNLALFVVFLVGVFAGEFAVDHGFTVPGMRLGLGSCGYALQRTSDWRVLSERHDLWCLGLPYRTGDNLPFGNI